MTTAVDLFAGAGGWTTGATQAGVQVLVAANHWATAVRSHRMNHPETLHLCQDLALLDPRTLPAHELLIASPACQGHTQARGTDKPHHDASRATAWCVVNIAEVTRPATLVVENVPGFKRWPLYNLWRQALEQLGYSVSEAVLDAADFGVPQERKRLFVVGTRNRKAPQLQAPQNPQHVPVRDIIDWSEGDWTEIDKPGRAAATLRRIEAGRERFGSRFVAPYYGSGSGETGRSIDRPLGTVTTLARWALVDGDRMRMLSLEENRRAMGFPSGYHLWGSQRDQLKQLGNAVPPPLARGVIEQLVA